MENKLQYLWVKPSGLKDGVPHDCVWLDEVTLQKIDDGILKKAQPETGGPTETPRQYPG